MKRMPYHCVSFSSFGPTWTTHWSPSELHLQAHRSIINCLSATRLELSPVLSVTKDQFTAHRLIWVPKLGTFVRWWNTCSSVFTCIGALGTLPPIRTGPGSLESIYRVSLTVDLCEGNEIISFKKILHQLGAPQKDKKIRHVPSVRICLDGPEYTEFSRVQQSSSLVRFHTAVNIYSRYLACCFFLCSLYSSIRNPLLSASAVIHPVSIRVYIRYSIRLLYLIPHSTTVSGAARIL